ncbi:V-type sodium ATP synthase, subunit E domain protein [Streptococcus pneumoniae GA41410]|nr:V-type sodium ATP synthase, subunit E domain protein [Streptococcus pneumoniae GA41410]
MSNLENLRESVIEQAHEKGRMKLLDSKRRLMMNLKCKSRSL